MGLLSDNIRYPDRLWISTDNVLFTNSGRISVLSWHKKPNGEKTVEYIRADRARVGVPENEREG